MRRKLNCPSSTCWLYHHSTEVNSLSTQLYPTMAIDPLTSSLAVIILILLIATVSWVICCRPKRRIIIELISSSEAHTRTLTPNYYQIEVEKPKRKNSEVQTTKSVWFERETEDTESPLHYSSLPASLASLPYCPLPCLPSAPVSEVEVEEEETEPSEEEQQTDNKPEEGAEERQPLNTAVSHSVSQSVIQYRQVRDPETTTEVLIHRIASIEKRLKQNNL